MANILKTIKEGLYFRLKQIDDYTWLTPEVLEKCYETLNKTVGVELENTEFEPLWEETIITHSGLEVELDSSHKKIDEVVSKYIPDIKFRFKAIVDLVTEKTVWELKCTSEISIDHKLQVIIYSWLWKMTDKPKKDFKILNIKTGEVWDMNLSEEEVEMVVIEILKSKYLKAVKKTDEEFIENCRRIVVL
jgi:hypothetical protein